jgi:hypothetical protein
MKKIALLIFTFTCITCFSQTQESNEEIFTVVEEMPQFPGGESEKIKFVQKNIIFPESAKKKQNFR